MAFGKDPKQLADVSSFRQSAAQAESFNPRRRGGGGGGGGGWKPTFIDRFTPSTGEPDSIRVLKGSYKIPKGQPDGSLVEANLAYYEFIDHFHGTLHKSFTCSAGPFGEFKGKGDPCLGHEMYWADRNAGRKNGPMSKREMYSFSVLHYAPYGHIEQIDRATGAVRTNSEGVPYMTWERVFAHERNKFAGKEIVDARVLHWDMGYGHFRTLLDYDKEIAKSCKSCGSRDSLELFAWTCSNVAECGEVLIDMATTSFSPEEIDEITGKPVRCARCGVVGMLEDRRDCSKCDNPSRSEIFDVDLKVKRIVDPTGKSNGTTLAITGWSNPGPIDARYTEIAKSLDLAKIFAPTPYEKQREMMGAAAAPARQPVTSHTREFTTLSPDGKTTPRY